LESNENCNLFNGEFVADGAGHVHYLTNGAGTESQTITAFVTKLLVNELGIAVAVHHTPATAAHESLKSQGGVGCRIKGAPLVG
jgi:hypothetical protein